MVLGCNDTTARVADLEHRRRIAGAETATIRERGAPQPAARNRGGSVWSLVAAVLGCLVPARVAKPVG